MRTILNILTLSVVTGITLISLKANAQEEPPQTIPVIIVTSPPYHPPGIDPLERPGPPSNGLDDKGQTQRQAKCDNFKALLVILKCSKAATAAPGADFNQLGVDTRRFSTVNASWAQPLLDFANALYNTGQQGGPAARANIVTTAYRAAIAGCKNGNPETRELCYIQIANFFGETSFPISGDLGNLLNTLYGLTPGGNDLASSEAGKLITQFGNAAVCTSIAADLDKNAC